MISWSWFLIFIGYQSVVFAHNLGDLGPGVGNYGECGSGKVAGPTKLATRIEFKRHENPGSGGRQRAGTVKRPFTILNNRIRRACFLRLSRVNWPIGFSDMKPTTRTKRQSPQPIRIIPYYVNANISGSETLNMLQADDGPVAYILNYFQRTLSVVPFQDSLRTPANAMCGSHVAVPDDHANPGVPNADYVYYITAVNDETCQGGFIVAFAGPCYVARFMDNRPIFGFVNFCPTVFTRYNSDFINTLSLHETTHALVFVPNLFDLFPSHDNVLSQQRIDGQDVSIITTPRVVQAARDHYDCPTLAGPLLENEGGELSRGSHWESRTLFPELMNGAIYETLASKTVISRMTLSLFEDSGWYTVNYEAGLTEGEFLWGNDEGCGFVTANCNTTSYPYACAPCCSQKIECSYDYQSAGYCRQATFFDNCAVVIPARFCNDTVSTNINLDLPQGSIMDYGPQSICVPSSDTNVANCVEHRCVQIQGTELMAYSLTVNGQTEWCYPDGQVNNGELECPPIRFACANSYIDLLSPTDDPIPPPLCDASCDSCTVAQNPAFCTNCVAGRRLNGNGPTTCLLNSNPCNGSTYSSNGQCVVCPTGCSLCNGPQNSDCLACDNNDLYRDTTNMLRSVCVTVCSAGTVQRVDVFGVRTCIMRRGSGSGGVVGAMTGVSSALIMLTFGAAVVMNM